MVISHIAAGYLPILIFFCVALAIALILLATPFLVAPFHPDPNKVSAYECGFDAFGDSRIPFDIRFYLVSILFIVFDVEVALLIPWVFSLHPENLFGFFAVISFLTILAVGFLYEWRRGALEW